jgi:hypothetical protein
MTLLGAARDGDAVLVTADSILWRTDGQGMASFQGTTVKFRRLRDSARGSDGYLLYGFSGSEHIGDRHGVQLESSMAWGRWDELIRVVGDMFHRANTAPGVTQDTLTAGLAAGSWALGLLAQNWNLF